MIDRKFTPQEISSDFVLKGMVRDGLDLTRENYIIRTWGDIPSDWSAELESELPEKLQDWDQFEGDRDEF